MQATRGGRRQNFREGLIRRLNVQQSISSSGQPLVPVTVADATTSSFSSDVPSHGGRRASMLGADIGDVAITAAAVAIARDAENSRHGTRCSFDGSSGRGSFSSLTLTALEAISTASDGHSSPSLTRPVTDGSLLGRESPKVAGTNDHSEHRRKSSSAVAHESPPHTVGVMRHVADEHALTPLSLRPPRARSSSASPVSPSAATRTSAQTAAAEEVGGKRAALSRRASVAGAAHFTHIHSSAAATAATKAGTASLSQRASFSSRASFDGSTVSARLALHNSLQTPSIPDTNPVAALSAVASSTEAAATDVSAIHGVLAALVAHQQCVRSRRLEAWAAALSTSGGFDEPAAVAAAAAAVLPVAPGSGDCKARPLMRELAPRRPVTKNHAAWVSWRDVSGGGGGCQHCGARFTLTQRRHHCRGCGALTCASCSQFRLLPRFERLCCFCDALLRGHALRPARPDSASFLAAIAAVELEEVTRRIEWGQPCAVAVGVSGVTPLHVAVCVCANVRARAATDSAVAATAAAAAASAASAGLGDGGSSSSSVNTSISRRGAINAWPPPALLIPWSGAAAEGEAVAAPLTPAAMSNAAGAAHKHPHTPPLPHAGGTFSPRLAGVAAVGALQHRTGGGGGGGSGGVAGSSPSKGSGRTAGLASAPTPMSPLVLLKQASPASGPGMGGVAAPAAAAAAAAAVDALALPGPAAPSPQLLPLPPLLGGALGGVAAPRISLAAAPTPPPPPPSLLKLPSALHLMHALTAAAAAAASPHALPVTPPAGGVTGDSSGSGVRRSPAAALVSSPAVSSVAVQSLQQLLLPMLALPSSGLVAPPQHVASFAATATGVPLDPVLERSARAIILLLLDNGADVVAASHSGRTPLHTAALWGTAAVVRLLLERGALQARRDAAGLTAYDYAVLRAGSGDQEGTAVQRVLDKRYETGSARLHGGRVARHFVAWSASLASAAAAPPIAPPPAAAATVLADDVNSEEAVASDALLEARAVAVARLTATCATGVVAPGDSTPSLLTSGSDVPQGEDKEGEDEEGEEEDDDEAAEESLAEALPMPSRAQLADMGITVLEPPAQALQANLMALRIDYERRSNAVMWTSHYTTTAVPPTTSAPSSAPAPSSSQHCDGAAADDALATRARLLELELLPPASVHELGWRREIALVSQAWRAGHTLSAAAVAAAAGASAGASAEGPETDVSSSVETAFAALNPSSVFNVPLTIRADRALRAQ
jgi:hypothetical protein